MKVSKEQFGIIAVVTLVIVGLLIWFFSSFDLLTCVPTDPSCVEPSIKFSPLFFFSSILIAVGLLLLFFMLKRHIQKKAKEEIGKNKNVDKNLYRNTIFGFLGIGVLLIVLGIQSHPPKSFYYIAVGILDVIFFLYLIFKKSKKRQAKP